MQIYIPHTANLINYFNILIFYLIFLLFTPHNPLLSPWVNFTAKTFFHTFEHS